MPWDLGNRLEAKTGSLLGLHVSSLCSSLSLLGLFGITLFQSAVSVHSWDAASRPGLCVLRGRMKTIQRRAVGMIEA